MELDPDETDGSALNDDSQIGITLNDMGTVKICVSECSNNKKYFFDQSAYTSMSDTGLSEGIVYPGDVGSKANIQYHTPELPFGTTATIAFGTEIFDQNADFASNTFTAPVTGKYRFDISIKVNGLSTQDSATYYYWTLVTSNRSYYHLSSVNELGSGNAGFTFSGSILADMDASDTASVTIIMGGTSGSGPSDISNDTYWSGNLVC